MRIGILWNHPTYNSHEETYRYACGGNTGNILFVTAIEQIFDGNRLPWHSSAEEVNNNYDLLIFPAANQLGVHSDMAPLIDVWRNYKIPILTLGLGIQCPINKEPVLKKGTQEWLDVLVQNNTNHNNPIFVRGNKTYTYLNKLYKQATIIPIGCPSQILINSNKQEVKENNRFEKLLCSAPHIAWTFTDQITQEIIEYISKNNTSSAFVIQSSLDAFLAAKGEINEHSINFLKEFRKKYNIEDADVWFNKFATTFTDLSTWIQHTKYFDYSINFRIHGCITSILGGLPSVLVPVDSRTLELAEMLKIPYSLDYTNTLKDLKNIAQTLNFDIIRHEWNRNMGVLYSYLADKKIPHNSLNI